MTSSVFKSRRKIAWWEYALVNLGELCLLLP